MLGKALTTAAAGNAAGEATYVEDVFSTYLYEGTRATQTITNGIDLDGEGGLVWARTRGTNSSHALYDTERGVTNNIFTNNTLAEASYSGSLTSFNSDGFTLGSDTTGGLVNYVIGEDHVSWTFRKAPKFFDVVTWTGTGSDQTISHNLGSVPGCIIIKDTSTTNNWIVWHNSIHSTVSESDVLLLNTVNANTAFGATYIETISSSSFVIKNGYSATNTSGRTYVAYLFAHNDGDGGFGENGDQDIIKCGSYTGGTAPISVDLGFEPQWILIKGAVGSTQNWVLFDTMRGIATGGADEFLSPNASSAETTFGSDYIDVTATGFEIKASNNGFVSTNSGTYIYIAIRRGPMKTPESGTEVFKPILSGDATGTQQNTGFPVDMQMLATRISFANAHGVVTRMLGASSTDTEGTAYLITSSTTSSFASGGGSAYSRKWNNEGYEIPSYWNGSSAAVFYNFRRAPGFFDVVAFTGDGTSSRNIPHNLGSTPELWIQKVRSTTGNWSVVANPDNATYYDLGYLNTGQWFNNALTWTNPPLTSTDIQIQNSGGLWNANNTDYIAYLFATLPGVSKVGSYTGNGTSQTIDCGFSAGARFVLIKRLNTTSDFHVYDSERGIVAGNDPRLELNTTDAEDTGSDDIDPVSSGFSVTSNADVNTNGASYLFLAIA